MVGNFIFENPTKIIFGEGSFNALSEELKKYPRRILFVYGGGSIKKNGIYEKICEILKESDKEVTELPGVMPNPTLEKLYEGIEVARKAKSEFILAVGGGSVIDYAKALSASVHLEGDPWEEYFTKFEEPTCEILPIGTVLTMVGTGSEMNGGSVITNKKLGMKVGKVFGTELFPKFSILDPTFTYSLPPYQMISGISDILSHLMEQYFSGHDDSVSDYLMEGLMRSVIDNSKIAVKNPTNYEARSNLMWAATLALNTLVECGKPGDWNVHMIGQAIGAITNAAHGMTLSAVEIPYYKMIYRDGLHQFAKFAKNVWMIPSEGKSEEELALAGINALENYLKEMGMSLSIKDFGATQKEIPNIVNATLLGNAGYHPLSKEEVKEILEASLND